MTSKQQIPQQESPDKDGSQYTEVNQENIKDFM